MTIEEFARRWAADPGARRTAAGGGTRRRPCATGCAARRAGLARALRGLGTGALPSLWDRLGELQMPVTLVVGERDEKFLAVARGMARRMADAEVVVVADAGHAVHLEAPSGHLGGPELTVGPSERSTGLKRRTRQPDRLRARRPSGLRFVLHEPAGGRRGRSNSPSVASPQGRSGAITAAACSAAAIPSGPSRVDARYTS